MSAQMRIKTEIAACRTIQRRRGSREKIQYQNAFHGFMSNPEFGFAHEQNLAKK
jgi:hypothetical protein